MLKEYTLTDGALVTVNLATIAYVTPEGTGTLIAFIGGATITVQESYDNVSGKKDETKVLGFGSRD